MGDKPDQRTIQFKGTDEKIQGKYQYKEEAGSTLPTSRVYLREEARNLYQAGAFGPPGSPQAVGSLLDYLDWPDADKITEQVQKGVVGLIAEKLQMAQVPPPIIQKFVEIATMDPKQIQQMVAQTQAQMAQAGGTPPPVLGQPQAPGPAQGE